MANPIGYNGSDMHVTHPSFWVDDGYVGVGADGYTIVSYCTGLTPAGVAYTSLAPNTVLKSITCNSSGLLTFTFKETWPAMLIPSFCTVNPTGFTTISLVSCTIGQSTASSPVSPVVTAQVVNASGSATTLAAHGGFFWQFILQNSTAYL